MTHKIIGIGFICILFVLHAVHSQAGLHREEPGRDDFYYDIFPQDFLFGFATSSYQIEGAWNIDGKGESSWDWVTHNQPELITGGATGDVACDSYHKFKEDVQLLKNAGANFYRFSLSWPRILPDGTTRNVNQAGLDYYNALIDELVANDIIPFVTLFHWDMPKQLIDNVGYWDNEEIPFYYANYTRVAYENFGDRVKHWLTFNEPMQFCVMQWAYGTYDPSTTYYLCEHHVVKAHALSYRIYENEFKASQNGQVGITVNSDWAEPLDGSSAADVAASHRHFDFGFGGFIHPLVYGEYPPIVRKLVDEKSAAEGRNESRLPTFDAEWTALVKDSLDFIGLNYYTSRYTTYTPNGDQEQETSIDPEWPVAAVPWLIQVPYGFRRLLNRIGMQYKNLPIWVTENGWTDHDYDGPVDPDRINYYRLHLTELLKAVKIDGVNVKGYTAWSLIDNMEWYDGYSVRMGTHHVNFTDPNLPRIPKDSALFLTKVFRDRGFPPVN